MASGGAPVSLFDTEEVRPNEVQCYDDDPNQVYLE